MIRVWNQSQNKIIFSNIKIADRLFSRIKGLLGKDSLAQDEALWIHQCQSVHTFGMKFSIDCIFLDKNLKVKSLSENVRPSRLVLPVIGATSVIEAAAGVIAKCQIQIGDQIYVGH